MIWYYIVLWIVYVELLKTLFILDAILPWNLYAEKLRMHMVSSCDPLNQSCGMEHWRRLGQIMWAKTTPESTAYGYSDSKPTCEINWPWQVETFQSAMKLVWEISEAGLSDKRIWSNTFCTPAASLWESAGGGANQKANCQCFASKD